MRKVTFAFSASLALGLLMLLLLLAEQPSVAAPDALTPIYDIQYTTTPGGDGTYPSPLVGQVVTTTGVVYAVYGRGFFIADDTGPWHGIYVYYPSGTMPQIGDLVQVRGEVQEYYGLTELSNGATYTVLSSGHTPYAPAVVNTADIQYDDADISEQYESVFVEVHNITVTAEIDTHGIWTFTDAGGGAGKADDWGYHLEPNVGDRFAILRGALVYDWNEFKVLPRDADDIVATFYLALSKTAPANVRPGERFTYTLEVVNNTGITLTQIVITDAVPISHATVAQILDGGTLMPGSTISWTAASLSSGGSLIVRFAVTATGNLGDDIQNRAYAVWASNRPTPTVEGPLLTIIGSYIPIYRIQGNGFRSPLVGANVKTIGVVSGFFEGNSPDYGNFDGFYIQDPNGDGDDTTSDGIFVKHSTGVNPGVSIGDLVTVTGVVDEFSEWDGPTCSGDECQTQIYITGAAAVQVNGTGSISPTVLDPPGDPDAALAYFEAREGMLTTLPMTGVVVGPTSYGTIMVIPGDEGVKRVMRGSPQEGMPFGVRPDERRGAGAPNLIVGSVVTGVDGPLAYTYGNYVVSDQDGYTVVYSQPLPSPVPTWPSPDGQEFSAATFNTYNFDGGESDKLTKVVSTVINLGAPTWVVLEEIATLPTCTDIGGRTVTGVISDLLAALSAQGYDYDYAASHPDVGCHGVAVLWDTARVTQVVTATYQTCSANGSSSSTAYDHYCDGTGLYPLFSRRPVVVTATVTTDAGPAQMVVIGNHFKSKRGGSAADQRRLEQGQFVAGLVDSFVTGETPYVLVMGDLNDFLDSPPLDALTAGGNLTDTLYLLPTEARYSYIYHGVSQVLDHILVSPRLLSAVTAVSPLHYNADFPYHPYSDDGSVVWRTSDHDPVAITFKLPWTVYLPLISKSP